MYTGYCAINQMHGIISDFAYFMDVFFNCNCLDIDPHCCYVANGRYHASDQKSDTEIFTATITCSGTHLASVLTARHLSDCPDFSSLIRTHKECPCLVKRQTCWSETIIVPDIRPYLPAFADIYIAHDVDDCGLAGRTCFWRSVGEVNLGDFVTYGTITIPK